MTANDMAQRRLSSQRLAGPRLERPEDVVRWMGAVQAQDYSVAKWALGVRTWDVTDEEVERAFSEGRILRTHVMRPTWHFVTPADIRWLLALTAPRVHKANAPYYRKLGLSEAVLARSDAALSEALRGGVQLTREELADVLADVIGPALAAGDAGPRLAYAVMHAELEGIICSGARRGKRFTYALLEERAPHAEVLKRDAALAELARRYFQSHGPATVQDLVWWSGLTTAEARRGLETIAEQLLQNIVGGRTYWSVPAAQGAAPAPSPTARPALPAPSPSAHLLPNYDEYESYKDRSAIFDTSNVGRLVFPHLMIVDGRVAGTWKRTVKKRTVVVETDSFVPLTSAGRRAVAQAAQRFGTFLGLSLELV